MNQLFCFGTPKSGTTFLQMILDAHPEVSCPSEHQLPLLEQQLAEALTRYNRIVRAVDQKTANQGTRPFRNAEAETLYAEAVKLAARRGAGDREPTWYGLNDNLLLSDPARYLKLFPRARFIAIVRDPHTVTLSSWHHNHRVEADFITRAGGSLESWAAKLSASWARDVRCIRTLHRQLPAEQFHVCYYEELRAQSADAFAALFDFLGVATDAAVIDRVMQATRFDQFQDGNFFRQAGGSHGKQELSNEARRSIEEVAGREMAEMGYRA